MEIEEFKERVIKACDDMISQGYKIISGGFGDIGTDLNNKLFIVRNENACLCPISCLLISEKIAINYSYLTSVINHCKIEDDDLYRFINGIDQVCEKVDDVVSKSPYYLFGKEIRKKYIEC